MNRKNIGELYTSSRFSSTNLFAIFLYCPFGILLMLLRGILGIQVFLFGFILPNVPLVQNLLCKLLCLALGITVNVENPRTNASAKVLISNCVSPFDSLVVHSVTGSVSPGKEIYNTLLSTVFGIKSFGSSTLNFANFKKNISEMITQGTVPVNFQPEAKQTNGKTILKFKSWPFELCNKVQPICIEVNRPILGLAVSIFDSALWTNTMWYFLSPYTSYTLKFMPVVEKGNLTENEFAENVRKELAAGLKVKLSEYSAADLLEWEKRIIEDYQRTQRVDLRPSTSSSPSSNSELNRMARQVKEVLPMVPMNVILTDLNKTRNVDQTITKILEGQVPYVPETVSQSPVTQSTPTSDKPFDSCNKQDSFNTAAPIFAKSAQERMLSFQERKQQLIEAAKRRYIEKHGLNIVGSS